MNSNESGPPLPRGKRPPYSRPSTKKPRLTLDISLPDGVRRGENGWGSRYHEYLQADGRWQQCGDRRRCRECIKEQAMKTTIDNLREALELHFGAAHMRSIHPDADLFGKSPLSLAEGRQNKSLHIDRMEMLDCIELEFGIMLPEEDAYGDVTLETLAKKIDAALETRGGR